MFQDLVHIISKASELHFDRASALAEEWVNTCEPFSEALQQIGIIPEVFEHDSTEEKLFAKASDAVLARALRELGLRAVVLMKRGDSADVLAKSAIHGYTLVADAKSFRMSRSAKNQKDFKVAALSGWRQDAEYAVLCAPYFQYPASLSQIYAQALTHNVCLLSWEHLAFLLENHVRESEEVNFSALWNFCDTYSHHVLCADMKKSFLREFNKTLAGVSGLEDDALDALLNRQIVRMRRRGEEEKAFWQEEIRKISAYTREQAVNALIREKKIPEKLNRISRYISGLRI